MTRWFLLVAALLAAPGARAVTCPAMPGAVPSLEQVDASARLQFIRSHLDADARNLALWKWTWAGVYGAATIGQGLLSPYSLSENREKWAVGGATSLIGFAATLLGQHRALGDSVDLAAQPAPMTPEATCALLKEAELFLQRDADDEYLGRSIFMNAANIGLNLIAGLVLGIVWHQWSNGMATFALGTAVGEIQIFTQPMGAAEALSYYQTGNVAPITPLSQAPVQLTAPGPGFQLALGF